MMFAPHRMFLTLICLCVAATFARGQDDAARLPDDDWKILDQQSVESSANYKKYEDVFTGVLITEWEGSPSAERYAPIDAWENPENLGDVVSRLLRLRKLVLQSEAFQEADGTAGNGKKLRDILLAEIGKLAESLHDIDLKVDQALTWSQVKNSVSMARLQRYTEEWKKSAGTDSGTDTVPWDRKVSDTVFFRGEKQQVILRIFTLKGNDLSPETLAVDYYATVDQAIEFRSALRRILWIFKDYQIGALESAVVRLKDIDRGWENYLEKGFSQYPWEVLINSWTTPHIGGSSWSRPPVNQLVIAHPEAAILLDIRDLDSASIEPALLIHGLGYIHYWGARRSWFTGASATVSLSGNSNLGLGYGPSLHLGHSAMAGTIPHISLSVLWHDAAQGSDGPIIGISADFWRLVSSDGGETLYKKFLPGFELPAPK